MHNVKKTVQSICGLNYGESHHIWHSISLTFSQRRVLVSEAVRPVLFDEMFESTQYCHSVTLHSRETTRLLGTPRQHHKRTNSREKLTPISLTRYLNQTQAAAADPRKQTSAADERIRSHSTSDVETSSSKSGHACMF